MRTWAMRLQFKLSYLTMCMSHAFEILMIRFKNIQSLYEDYKKCGDGRIIKILLCF